MKSEVVTKNGHNLRRGFTNNTFSSWEERKEHDRNDYKLAIRYMRKRLRLNSGKQRISHFLMTTKIPQTFDKFLMPHAHKACTLGAIHIGAGGKFSDQEINWWRIRIRFDVFDQEWSRPVKCPECKHRDTLAAIMYHLNDVHRKSNYSIGKWLKKYHL